MRRPVTIEAPKGKLGVLTPGMGAVSTTFMAGVELVRNGDPPPTRSPPTKAHHASAPPIGSLTQMGTVRLGKRTEKRTPRINDFVPLAKPQDLVFGGWDVFPDNAYEAAAKGGVLEHNHLSKVEKFLKGIRPLKAPFDPEFVKNLHGTHVKKGKNKRDLAEQLRDDIRAFKKKTGVDRIVMIWCGSTEAFLKPGPTHATVASFEKAMKENHPSIAPSMLYAYAALQEDIPFANGAPNLTVDIPAMQQLAKEKALPIGGKDFKTGQTLMKTILAPGFKARMLGLNGWFSTN